MKFDSKKLIADLIHANQRAFDAVANQNDGGTANRDSVFLRIPRVKETEVLSAIKEAGLHCRSKTEWIGKGYMITPTSIGQQGS